jgi:hypothetical protein
MQPRNKRAFEYTAITIGPFLFSTIESEYFFYIKYEDDIGSNDNYTGNNGDSKQKQMYREILYNYQHKLDILIVPLLLIVMADLCSAGPYDMP